MDSANINPAVNVGTKRWRYEVVGIIMMLALGIIYGWSNFVKPIQAEMGWGSDDLALAYSICTTMHCFGSLFGGFLCKRIKSRIVLVSGMVVMCLGFILSSMATSIAMLAIGYGFLVGGGAGMSYNALIGIIVPWFPDKKGLASGLLFMSFGFCSMVFGTYAVPLIAAVGWRGAFRVVGLVYAGIVILCTLFIRPVGENDVLPPAASAGGKKTNIVPMEITGWTMIKRPTFICFFFWGAFMCGCGLLMIGHASPIAQEVGFTASAAALLTGVLTGFNGLGRVSFGAIADRKGTSIVMALGSLLFVGGSLLMFYSIKSGNIYAMVLAFVMMGFAYGSVTPTTTTVMSGFYGMQFYALNVGIANLNVFPSSFGGPYISGILVEGSGSYASTALFVCALGVAAFILSRFIRKP